MVMYKILRSFRDDDAKDGKGNPCKTFYEQGKTSEFDNDKAAKFISMRLISKMGDNGKGILAKPVPETADKKPGDENAMLNPGSDNVDTANGKDKGKK